MFPGEPTDEEEEEVMVLSHSPCGKQEMAEC